MTLFEPSSRARRDPRRRRRGLLVRTGVAVGAAAVLFGVGVALGEALHDNPSPGGDRTYVRRLRVREVGSPPRTVTVTVTSAGVSKSSALGRFVPAA